VTRVRIAGSKGTVESALIERKVTLTAAGDRPRSLSLTPQVDVFTQFAQSLRGEGKPPLSLREACRITEISIKAQKAADTRSVVSLDNSPYRAP
jgi:hypothetical protein